MTHEPERRTGVERRIDWQPGKGLPLLLVGMIAAGLWCLATHASAAERTARFAWLDPDRTTEGEPFVDGDFDQVRLYLQQTGGDQLLRTYPPGTLLADETLDLVDGIHCFYMTASGRGGESQASNVVCRTWSEGGTGDPVYFSLPAPPTGFSVEFI